jgi:multidrug efflux pump subunit AcrB
VEQQLSQIPGVTQLTSSSALGVAQLTVQFELSRTVDCAATDVLAAINAASPYLPPNIPYPPTIRKVNPAETPIMLIALSSDSLPLTTADAYAENILLPKISQIPGVGLVGIGGQQKPAIRIRVNPQALAAGGISLEDVRSVVWRFFRTRYVRMPNMGIPRNNRRRFQRRSRALQGRMAQAIRGNVTL